MSDEAIDQRIRKLVDSPLFPLTREFTLKDRPAPLSAELPRDGEGGRPCHSCGRKDRVLWGNDRWQIAAMPVSGNPVLLFLETVEHVDFEDLDEPMAQEFGMLSWRLEAAIRTIEGVGRVHIHRWGDGSAHFHVWFQGRPARQLECYGYGNVLWPLVCDPLPADVVGANHQRVLEAFVSGANLRR
jgi:hypothetical protein